MGLRKPKKAEEIKLPDLTNAAAPSHILKDYQALNGDGEVMVGSMSNQGAKSAALNAGGSFTIPAGFHNGSGVVTANSLASQTSATATAVDIKSGKTAFVNGQKITGSFVELHSYVGQVSVRTSVSTTVGSQNWTGLNKTNFEDTSILSAGDFMIATNKTNVYAMYTGYSIVVINCNNAQVNCSGLVFNVYRKN